MLPKPELQALQTLDFAGKGEAFVESRFLTPLLGCLGYESHKDYEVIRHGDDGSRFKLVYPPVERGAQRSREYSPDYLPTIRKKMFWIVEAKSPKDVEYPFAGSMLVQGLQYCVHPEIQAKYLLITNGENSALFNAHGSIFMGDDIYRPILEFQAKELVAKWSDIYRLLSVETLRRRIEEDLRQMYDKLALSSLDKDYPHELLKNIGESARSHSQEIEKRVRSLRLAEIERGNQAWLTMVEQSDAEQLFAQMDRPLRAGPRQEATCFVDKSLSVGTTAQQIADRLITDFDRQGVFSKLQRFVALCHLYQRSAEPAIHSRCRTFFDRHKDAELPLLNQVECAWLRVTRKLMVTDIYRPLRERFQKELKTAAELVRFVSRPTALQSTYAVELQWNREALAELRALPAEELQQRLTNLLQVESAIEADFRDAHAKLPDDEKELVTGFENYGIGGKLFQFAAILRGCGLEPDIDAE